jgi:hypothetical protein
LPHELSFFANFIDDQSNINPLKPEELNTMKTEQLIDPNKTVFLQTVAIALGNLKQQLQRDYERAYPDLREIIHLVLDEEESRAWDLTLFPHLLLPDLVEAHVANLNLRPVETKRADVFAPRRLDKMEAHQLAFALCS